MCYVKIKEETIYIVYAFSWDSQSKKRNIVIDSVHTMMRLMAQGWYLQVNYLCFRVRCSYLS